MKPLLERFEGKYQAVPWSGCWLWTGKTDEKGYGRIAIESSYVYAHRASYELHRGPFRAELHVLHRCDVPCCVNPDHLFLGTQADNNADRDRKGRHAALPGQENGMAKLDADLVRLIRASSESSIALSHRIDIDASTIRKVRRRETWRHV